MRSCSRWAAATRSCSISRPRRIADSDAFRLLHGAADGVAGLSIDRFADTLVVHADSARALLALPSELRTFASATARIHPREARRATAAVRVLWGEVPEALTVCERGVRFEIRPLAGLNVGLFVDMREVRSWVRSVAAGRTVLNLFAYTCSFGVCAMLGSAARVLNLDLSRGYLDWGRVNYGLNGVAAAAEDFVYGDAFDWLGRFARRGTSFELVIVDPPSFSTTRGASFSVERDYQRLVEAAARTVSPGGMLLAATNHATTTDARFDAWLRHGLASAGRRGRLEQRWNEPAEDFPLLPGQQPYLKVRALQLD